MIEGQNDGDSASALTVDSAATALEGLLSGKPEKKQPEATQDDETPEAPSPEEEQGEEPEASEEEPEESDDEPSDEDDEPEEEPEQPAKHRLTVDGEEVEVTLDELLKGYSRTSDYTRKTQKLAEDRRKFDTETAPERDALRGERQRYAEHITELETALKTLAAEPDWETLRRENPEMFAETWAAWDQHTKKLAKIGEERQRAFEAVEADMVAKHQTYLAAEHTRLLEAVPAWADEATAKKESAELVTYGKKLGFTDEDLRGVSDHRALVALRKAMLYDKHVTEKEAAAKLAKGRIEAVKVVSPGPAGKVKGKASEAIRATKRHAKVGSVDSAAEALKLMLDD